MPEHEEDWEKWSAQLADATAEAIEEQERREAEAPSKGRAGVYVYSVNISVASGVGLHWPRPWRLWPDWRDATVVAK